MNLASGDGHVCIASCTHDLGGETRLFSYAPVADTRIHQGEAMAIKAFGIPVRSPLTPYISVWHSEFSPRMDAHTPPKKVYLNAIFGDDPWHPPASLVEHAELRQRRDELIFAAVWAVDGADPVLERFAVEIRADGGHTHFRSMHDDENARMLDIAWGSLHLPAHGADNVSFNLRAVMPERYNFREDLRGRRVEVNLTGSAGPIPGWINY
ncbi:hypothetical protein [Qipengyuania sp. RANM35]|uniref:hypothetical protein n=1 Tax=Qipengyuania sp. RANM35 TaxID=3068635 RepID=UPI0034DB0CFB